MISGTSNRNDSHAFLFVPKQKLSTIKSLREQHSKLKKLTTMGFFDLFKSQDEKAKLSHLKNLISAGFADGLIINDEFLAIVEIMKREGIDRNAIEYYINHFKYIHFVEPTTVETKKLI